MRVIISGRGVVITPAFRARVDGKVQKLSRILPNIHEAKVVLARQVRQTKDRLRQRKPRRSTPGTRAPTPQARVPGVGAPVGR
jgi:ribosome-associated translation inhibitor RaiA